jgi:hypothetical protein
MKELGIQLIPAYSPQARGRSGNNTDGIAFLIIKEIYSVMLSLYVLLDDRFWSS